MQQAKTHDFWVTLNDTHAQEWEAVLGADRGRRLPVKSPIAVLANLTGFQVPQRVFLLAIDEMKPEDIAKIAAKLAARFGLTQEESEAEVRNAGIPIREEHTSSVMVHNPQRWF